MTSLALNNWALLINDALQQKIYFSGNIFGNKCCPCNEGSLYFHFLLGLHPVL